MSKRVTLTLSVVFLAGHCYLLGREIIAPMVVLPTLPRAMEINTLVLMLFSLCHAGYLLGWRLSVVFFAISAVVSWAFEQVGVETGAIYGPYHYSDMLGAKLGHVPVLIPIAWFMMIYPSYVIANLIVLGRPISGRMNWLSLVAVSFVSAMVMTAWDLPMDPGMSGAGHWVWEQGGPYFGVPLQNYAGWMMTTFAVYLLYRWWEHRSRPGPALRERPSVVAMPILAYSLFALFYSVHGRPEGVRVVAFFAMGLPALLAAIQLWRPRLLS